MIKYKFEEIEINSYIDMEEALENPEVVGQLMGALKDIFPETKNQKESYIFQDRKNGLHFIVLPKSLIFVGGKGSNMEKSKEILATCFDSIGKLMIKEGQKYNRLEITLKLIAVPSDNLDTEKCFKKISKLIFKDSISEDLRHIGIQLKVDDKLISFGVMPYVVEEKKTAFICTFNAYADEMEFNHYKYYLDLLDKASKTRALDVLNNIIKL